jgi:hypothetical protein
VVEPGLRARDDNVGSSGSLGEVVLSGKLDTEWAAFWGRLGPIMHGVEQWVDFIKTALEFLENLAIAEEKAIDGFDVAISEA